MKPSSTTYRQKDMNNNLLNLTGFSSNLIFKTIEMNTLTAIYSNKESNFFESGTYLIK